MLFSNTSEYVLLLTELTVTAPAPDNAQSEFEYPAAKPMVMDSIFALCSALASIAEVAIISERTILVDTVPECVLIEIPKPKAPAVPPVAPPFPVVSFLREAPLAPPPYADTLELSFAFNLTLPPLVIANDPFESMRLADTSPSMSFNEMDASIAPPSKVAPAATV